MTTRNEASGDAAVHQGSNETAAGGVAAQSHPSKGVTAQSNPSLDKRRSSTARRSARKRSAKKSQRKR